MVQDLGQEACRVRVPLEPVLAAVRRCGTASLSFWDALIVEAALGAGCTTLLTEDLRDGRSFGPLAVVNPFRGL